MIEFTILGSGTAVPFEQRASSSYLLQYNNTSILLDTGFWVVERLEQANFSIANLDFIFLSHKHPDHFMGLIHILFALKNPIIQKSTPLTIFGFKGLKNYFEKFKSILNNWIEPDVNISFIEKEKENFHNFSYSLFKTKHSEESVGIKIFINNKKIVYTSDTEFFPELKEHIDNSDILVIECASPIGKKIVGHLNFNEIIDITKSLNINKIILTHFYPDSLPSQELNKKFILGNDLLNIKIN